MGATRVSVGPSRATCPTLETTLHDLHDLLYSVHVALRQADYIDLLFTIFSAMEGQSLIEQIVQLATVYFIEADLQKVVLIVLKLIDDIHSCQQIQAWHLSIISSHHGVGFARASLAVRKAGCIGAFKSAVDKRLDAFVVQLSDKDSLDKSNA